MASCFAVARVSHRVVSSLWACLECHYIPNAAVHATTRDFLQSIVAIIITANQETIILLLLGDDCYGGDNDGDDDDEEGRDRD